MKCSLGISNFLEEISSLSHSIVFFYFFALITEEDFLISPCYPLELCILGGEGGWDAPSKLGLGCVPRGMVWVRGQPGQDLSPVPGRLHSGEPTVSKALHYASPHSDKSDCFGNYEEVR